MTQVTLNPTADVHINSDTPTVNQNGVGFIDVGEPTGAVSIRRLLIKFDLSSIPSNATFSAATLRLYDTGTDVTDNARTMNVHRLLRAFTETTATWNTTDGSTNWGTAGADNTTTDRETGTVGTISMPNPPVVGYVDITLTASLVQDWVDGDLTNNGFLLKMSTEGDDLHRFDSRNETNKPELVITYTVPGTNNQSYSFVI